MTGKYRTNDDYMLREIAGEAVLVPVGENTKISNGMINLNETCAFLWKVFGEPKTLDEAYAEVIKEFQGSEEEIKRDIAAFVSQGLPMELIIKTEE